MPILTARNYMDVKRYPKRFEEHVNGKLDTAAGTLQTVWPLGGLYVKPPSAGEAMTVSSADAGDTLLGIGAKQVLIRALAANFLVIDAFIVDMAGLLGSPLPIEPSRIIDISVWGDQGALGDIYVGSGIVDGAGKPAVVYGIVKQGDNESRQTMYPIPANHVGLIYGGNVHSPSGKVTSPQFIFQHEGGVALNKLDFKTIQASYAEIWKFPAVVPEKTDIEIRASVTNPPFEISGGYELEVVRVQDDPE